MTLHCPTCGHEIEEVPAKALRELPVHRQQKLILAALVAAYPDATTSEHLLHVLYDEAPKPPPAEAGAVLKVQISRLRQILPRHGWFIPKHGYGSSGRYRLEKL